MVTVPRRKFLERIDTIPEAVRNVAFSTETGNLLRAIGKTYHLDDRKADALVALTGAVLLGFLHHTDLIKEIQENTKVDVKIAQSIADEIKQKVFARVETALSEIYEPVLSTEEVAEEPAAPAAVRVEAVPQAPSTAPIPVTFTLPKVPAAGARQPSSGPFILHEEKGVAAEAPKGFKGFSIPLSFLRPKAAADTVPKATARVETPPAVAPAEKKEKPRVVHYSELRTPLSPFGQNEEFINLETFEKFTPPSPGYGRASPLPAVSIKPLVEETPPPASPAAPSPSTPPVESAPKIIAESTPKTVQEPQPPAPAENPVPPPATEGGEPKLKGNTINLK